MTILATPLITVVNVRFYCIRDRKPGFAVEEISLALIRNNNNFIVISPGDVIPVFKPPIYQKW